MAASALAPLSLGVSEPALAQCTGSPDSVTCPVAPQNNPYSFGFAGNPYSPLGSAGINVNTINTPIQVTLDSGVRVDIPAGAPGVNAVNAANSTGVTLGGADITIIANGLTINNAVNPGGNNQTGLRIQSSGDARITATNTAIDVSGTASDWGILAFAMPNTTETRHDVSVNWSGAGSAGITSTGTESGGIQATNRGTGNATIDASGNITVTPGVGAGVYGLIARAGTAEIRPGNGVGDASVTYHSGTINAFGSSPRGIVAWVQGDGSATVITDPGTVINISGSTDPGVVPPTLPVRAGIVLQSDQATAANRRGVDNHELRGRHPRSQQ